MTITHDSVSQALAHAEQAVHDLKSAQWVLIEDPLTRLERDDLNGLIKSAEDQMKVSLKILEP